MVVAWFLVSGLTTPLRLNPLRLMASLDGAPPPDVKTGKSFLSQVKNLCHECGEQQQRLEWDEYFGSMALLASARSPCERLHVGCVLVRDRRVLSRATKECFNGTSTRVCSDRWSQNTHSPYEDLRRDDHPSQHHMSSETEWETEPKIQSLQR